MTVYRLHLTPEERLILESWIKKGKHSTKKVQQAQILLNSDENVERKSSTLLKDILGVSVKTIERVRRQFCEEGMEIFILKPRKTGGSLKFEANFLYYWTYRSFPWSAFLKISFSTPINRFKDQILEAV